MTMDSTTIEELLHEEEGVALDFKSAQYPFKGATDYQKSEIVKDILAFANAWRRTTAYILIGVEEKKGRRSKVVGINDHLDDSDIQQLVLSKTNKPVRFSYKATRFEGKDIGLFKIPNQPSERPFYITQDYGKLNEGDVPIRRSSSTEDANPDEIKKMGIKEIDNKKENQVKVGWSKEKDISLASRSIELESEVAEITDLENIEDVPEYRSNKRYPVMNVEPINEEYYRELIIFEKQKRLTEKVLIIMKNMGGSVMKNSKVRLRSTSNSIVFLEREPYEPSKKKILGMPFTSEPAVIKDEIDLGLGDIQPGDRRWSPQFWVGGYEDGEFRVDCEIFADDLNTSDVLTCQVTVKTTEVTIKEMITNAGES